ncbi:MAG: hypothetical protein L0H15_00490 [Nitrosospira sp.]|nr:hypothetical protein [Nitrosospira sp.]
MKESILAVNLSKIESIVQELPPIGKRSELKVKPTKFSGSPRKCGAAPG